MSITTKSSGQNARTVDFKERKMGSPTHNDKLKAQMPRVKLRERAYFEQKLISLRVPSSIALDMNRDMSKTG